MNRVNRITTKLVALSLAIQAGCQMPSKQNQDFSALTTPVSYRSDAETEKSQPEGFVGEATDAAKKTAMFVGKGVLLAAGLVAWMWLDDDDETIIEKQSRERDKQRWKNAWRDNPQINPAMTAAFKDDQE